MKEFQKKQEEEKLRAMKNEEEKLRLQEELERQREEKLRLEKERREKKKQKEKERIQRKKEEGSYLTKEQREKLERARIQLEAAGIQVPARNTAQAGASNGEQPGKKRVLYEDRRRKTQTNAKRMSFAHLNYLLWTETSRLQLLCLYSTSKICCNTPNRDSNEKIFLNRNLILPVFFRNK